MLGQKHLHILRKLLHLVFFFAVYLELKRNIDSRSYDLFMVRYSLSNCFILSYLHSKKSRMMLEVHGLAYKEEKQHWRTAVPGWYFVVLAGIEKRLLRWADCLTVVSAAIKDTLVRIGIDEEKIHVVHNGVDLRKFDCHSEPDRVIKEYDLEGKFVVGFVGSFARYHGVEMLVRLAKSLRQRCGNIVFLLVGRNFHGPEDPMAVILKEGLSEAFTFTGEVPHATIPPLIAAMDIGLIPDSNTYGSPMKLFEYMAMRKAVVAVDVPPIREVIKHGQTGILFERGNIGQAEEWIEKLIVDEELRYKLGRQAYLQVVRSHTWARNAERIVQIATAMIE
jgi:glycosyltransferase involved in cell wall biosynthesis